MRGVIFVNGEFNCDCRNSELEQSCRQTHGQRLLTYTLTTLCYLDAKQDDIMRSPFQKKKLCNCFCQSGLFELREHTDCINDFYMSPVFSPFSVLSPMAVHYNRRGWQLSEYSKYDYTYIPSQHCSDRDTTTAAAAAFPSSRETYTMMRISSSSVILFFSFMKWMLQEKNVHTVETCRYSRNTNICAHFEKCNIYSGYFYLFSFSLFLSLFLAEKNNMKRVTVAVLEQLESITVHYHPTSIVFSRE